MAKVGRKLSLDDVDVKCRSAWKNKWHRGKLLVGNQMIMLHQESTTRPCKRTSSCIKIYDMEKIVGVHSFVKIFPGNRSYRIVELTTKRGGVIKLRVSHSNLQQGTDDDVDKIETLLQVINYNIGLKEVKVKHIFQERLSYKLMDRTF